MAKVLIHKKHTELVDGKIRVISKARQYYVADPTKDFHCSEGLLKKSDLKKSKVKTNKGFEFYIFDATFADRYRRIARGPQTIPLKDIGLIIATTGLNQESKVVDAGAGSGALAIALANIAKEVHTYDINDTHLAIAQENVKKLEIKNCIVKKHDITKSIPEKNVDLVNLDMPEPWLVIPHAIKALKKGAWLVSYSPTIPQVMDFCAAVHKREELFIVKTIELIERYWEIDERRVRPKTEGIGHSGFLTFVRKVW